MGYFFLFILTLQGPSDLIGQAIRVDHKRTDRLERDCFGLNGVLRNFMWARVCVFAVWIMQSARPEPRTERLQWKLWEFRMEMRRFYSLSHHQGVSRPKHEIEGNWLGGAFYWAVLKWRQSERAVESHTLWSTDWWVGGCGGRGGGVAVNHGWRDQSIYCSWSGVEKHTTHKHLWWFRHSCREMLQSERDFCLFFVSHD